MKTPVSRGFSFLRIKSEMGSDPREDRFWEKLEVIDDCWIWQGATTPDGYGRFRTDDGLETAAARYAYRKYESEIPPKHLLYHACGEPGCVNPEHMRPVTPTEHTRLSGGPVGTNSRKKECRNGHPLSGDNLVINSEGRRKCRTCQKRIAAAKKARFKGPRKPKPNKTTLRKQIKTMTNVALGEFYGVTDTAIRKWMKSYDLERKRS